MAEQILFSILTVITLVSAFIVVTDRNLFHAAVAMMLSFFGVAGFYAMLNAGFLAAAQLLVYIGAISILVIFAIMMTRRLMSTTEPATNSQALGAFVAAVGLFGVLAFVIYQMGDFFNVAPKEASDATLSSSVEVLGNLLASPNGYVLPFEAASILLLAALVGAIVVARPDIGSEEIE